MSQEAVRQHIRAALDQVVRSEEDRLNAYYRALKGDSDRGEALMRPVNEALDALRDETSSVEGLSIDTRPSNSEVKLVGRVTKTWIRIGVSLEAEFKVETLVTYSFDDHPSETTRKTSSPEDVLKWVLEEVGTHIAYQNTKS